MAKAVLQRESMTPEEVLMALNSCVLKLGAGPIEVGLGIALREIKHLEATDLPEELLPKFDQFAKLASATGQWPLPKEMDLDTSILALQTEDRYHLCIEILGLHAQYLHWHMNRNRPKVARPEDFEVL